jgi:hypothetical protein
VPEDGFEYSFQPAWKRASGRLDNAPSAEVAAPASARKARLLTKGHR